MKKVRSEVLSRTQPNLIDLGIAIAAGGLSGFGKLKKDVSDALAGTAIAVALMPPLCVVGLSFSQNLYDYSQGAFLLYLTNLLGITLSCMIVFIFSGYLKFNHTFVWSLILTVLLLVPLGASFVRLVKQENLKSQITKQLIEKTITAE